MTPSDKTSDDVQPQNLGRDAEAVSPYEAPVLIPLGNVHALLAGNGTSTAKDSPPISRRKG